MDKYIKDILSKNIYESPDFEKAIKSASLERKRKTNDSLMKKIITTIIGILTIGGVVFAVQTSFMNNTHSQKEDNYYTSSNQYKQHLNTEYKTIDDLSIKINSIEMDNYRIAVEIEYMYKDDITSVESNIKISDEKNNIIYNDASYKNNLFNKINRNKYGSIQNNINVNTENQYIYTSKMESLYERINNNHIKRKLFLYTDLDEQHFPTADKIYVDINNITLSNNGKTVRKETYNFSFEINLDSKITKRIENEYIAENEAQNFKLLRCVQSNTQLKLEILYKGKENLNKFINEVNFDGINIVDDITGKVLHGKRISITDNIIKVDCDVDANILSEKLKIVINGDNVILINKK